MNDDELSLAISRRRVVGRDPSIETIRSSNEMRRLLVSVIAWERFRPPVSVAAVLGTFALAFALSGCSGTSACSTGIGASTKNVVVGCGGPYDDIYREIYTPGRGTDWGA